MIFKAVTDGAIKENNYIKGLGKDFKWDDSVSSIKNIANALKTMLTPAVKDAKNEIELLYNDDAIVWFDEYEEAVKSGHVATKNFFEECDDANLHNYLKSLGDQKPTWDGYVDFTNKAIKAQDGVATSAAKAAASQKMMALVMNVGVTMAITALIAGLTALVTYQEKARQAAEEAAKVYKSAQSDLYDYAKEIDNLRESLDSRLLSAAEEKRTIEDLMAIQDKLIEKYGFQAKGIDLVNGSIQDQIDLLRELRIENARNFLAENGDEVDKAINALTSKQSYRLTTPIWFKSEELKAAIDEIVAKYPDMTMDIDTGGYYVSVYADVFDAEQQINGFIDDLQSIKHEFEEFDEIVGKGPIEWLLGNNITYWEGIGEKAYEALGEVLREKQLNDEHFWEGLDAKMHEDKEALPLFEAYEKAIRDVNQALAERKDSDEVDNAIKDYQIAKEALDSFLESAPVYVFLQEQIGKGLSETGIAAHLFSKEMHDTNSDVSELADQVKGLKLTSEELLSVYDTSDEPEVFKALREKAKESGVTVNKLIDILLQYNYLADKRTPVNVFEDGLNSAEELMQRFQAVNSELKTLEDSYNNVADALDEYTATGEISAETFTKLMEMSDDLIAILFDEEGQLHLNTEAYIELAKAKLQELAITRARAMLDRVGAIQDETEAVDALTKSTIASTDAWGDLYGQALEIADANNWENSTLIEMVDAIHRAQILYDNAANNLEQKIRSGGWRRDRNSGTKSGGSSNSEPDPFQVEYNENKYKYDKGEINHKQYLDKLHELNEQYHERDSEKWRQYDLEIYNARKQIMQDYYDWEEKKAKAYADAIIKNLDDRIKSLRSKIEEEDARYDRKIERLKDQLKLLDEEWQKEDELLKIEKAREELQRLKNQKSVQIYREGQGFVWEVDSEAVANAQNNLDKLLQDWERQQQKLNLQKQIDDLEAAKKRNREAIEEQIKHIEDLKSKWQDNLSQIGVALEDYELSLAKTAEVEALTLADMLEEHKKFTDSVVELARKRKDAMEDVDKNFSDKHYERNNSGYAGYASGTLSTKSGFFIDGELGPELRVSGGGEGIVPATITKRLWDFGINPEQTLARAMSQASLKSSFVAPTLGTSGGNITLSIGDINLSGVQDVQTLGDQIVRQLPNAVMQAMYKRR